MDIEALTRRASELAHIIICSPASNSMLKEDARLLAIDCEATRKPSPEELDVLSKSYTGLLKRAIRAGITD